MHGKLPRSEILIRRLDLIKIPPSMTYDVAISPGRSDIALRGGTRYEIAFVQVEVSPFPGVDVAPSPDPGPDRSDEPGFLEEFAPCGGLKTLPGLKPTSWRDPPSVVDRLLSRLKKE